MHEKDPYTLFTASYLLSSFAGLAALLRSGIPLSWRLVLSAFLNSGLLGVAVAMIWCELYGDIKYPWFMLGVSILAGLGGTSLVDFVFQLIREGLRAYAERLQKSVPVLPDHPQPQPQTPPDEKK